ncbi:MAG TPA: N-acetylneuraminate synthase [Methylomusa anaerophila]|uniref:N,N'-diacetyllegionaminic acid synthase n=1 Tax=Methylomusa anaerophila TaxID=1930071 RepID=A0A348AKV5_9FIRM|nr:N-acetylneuraminate synthase [Methylomusa anaerophila]BBB91703.1 N,N'-diacetyllegionaminic acid synthase [Methylomusa anaerophila]HML88562.1 N-acetylneuraminate synthase [Methylomusa anaerophila]
MTETFIIAEIGVNHNGSIDLAKELIKVAADAGANAAKFQTFKTEKLVAKKAPKADYQCLTTDSNETQHEMLKKLEFSFQEFAALSNDCRQQDIMFLSTPFDEDSLFYLSNDLNVPYIKIPSGELTNAPFLLCAARTGKPIILSTGMSTLGDIEAALGVLAYGYMSQTEPSGISAFQKAYSSLAGQEVLKKNVVLLHCTTEYPAPFAEVNLKAMDTLGQAFGLPVGYSDHTAGIAVSIAAVARGAVVLEKHFTLDRNLPGPDHQASLEPEELKNLVRSVREVEQALGDGRKSPTPAELRNRLIARKSLVAARKIAYGEPFTAENVTCKRPGDGVSPLYYWECLDRKAQRDFDKDEKIEL